jgi:hypothetical protein
MINPYAALEHDWYNDGIIKSYYTPTPDTWGIVRTDYADATGSGHIVINEYDSGMNRAVFTYYSETTIVQKVDFYETQDALNTFVRSDNYLSDGATLDYRSYANGNIDWYYSDVLVRKHFNFQTNFTTEYLDENYSGTGIGRISKTTDSIGATTEYQSYYGTKNTARFVYRYYSHALSGMLTSHIMTIGPPHPTGCRH